MTYQEAQPRASAIKEAVLARRMPPWGAVKGFGNFRNEQGLTQEQISLVTDWVEGGTVRGNNPNALPPIPTFEPPAPFKVPSNTITVTDGMPLARDVTVEGLLSGACTESRIHADCCHAPERHALSRSSGSTSIRTATGTCSSSGDRCSFRPAASSAVSAAMQDPSDSGGRGETMTWRHCDVTWALVLAMAALQLRCGRTGGTMTELQRIKAGELDVVVLSPRDALQHGQDTFVLEFRKRGTLVDVGDVRAQREHADAGNADVRQC